MGKYFKQSSTKQFYFKYLNKLMKFSHILSLSIHYYYSEIASVQPAVPGPVHDTLCSYVIILSFRFQPQGKKIQ